MPPTVKTRTYDARGRRSAAEQTRLRVLRAARDLFTTEGYEGTSVSAIAAAAQVSVDTIYASVGRKPQLLLAVHDMELADAPTPQAAGERDYVRQIRAADRAADKIAIYAAALADRLPRTVPLMAALRAAGAKDPACLAVHESLSQRRAANMREFAEDLLRTGELRPDLTVEEIATLVWSMNSPDYFLLLAGAGHTPGDYAALITKVWTRTFLPTPEADRG